MLDTTTSTGKKISDAIIDIALASVSALIGWKIKEYQLDNSLSRSFKKAKSKSSQTKAKTVNERVGSYDDDDGNDSYEDFMKKMKAKIKQEGTPIGKISTKTKARDKKALPPLEPSFNDEDLRRNYLRALMQSQRDYPAIYYGEEYGHWIRSKRE